MSMEEETMWMEGQSSLHLDFSLEDLEKIMK